MYAEHKISSPPLIRYPSPPSNLERQYPARIAMGDSITMRLALNAITILPEQRGQFAVPFER
jgi:hypothetical protein